jgi:tellurite resistance-related uncharacterized protein
LKSLPRELEHYKSTPVFNELTIPKALLCEHQTKAGSWGLILVISGKLEYVITAGAEDEVHVLEAGLPGVVEPQTLHYVRPLGAVRFQVDFYR